MARIDELRLITRVAHMYYEENNKQSQISEILGMSQATVSRLIQRAAKEGIVRFSISVPPGIYLDLENSIKAKYAIKDIVVADCSEDNEQTANTAIAAAAAFWLETSLGENEVIGISSWSSTLHLMLKSLHPLKNKNAVKIIQLLGGMGLAKAQMRATEFAVGLAHATCSTAQLLPAPCITSSHESRNILMEEEQVKKVIGQFSDVTLAMVGIGSILPSENLVYSGNSFSNSELDNLANNGAVGDILLRFFDDTGHAIKGDIDERVIGMPLENLKQVSRIVGVAGGNNKIGAVDAALRGKLLTTLITDRFTAEKLVKL